MLFYYPHFFNHLNSSQCSNPVTHTWFFNSHINSWCTSISAYFRSKTDKSNLDSITYNCATFILKYISCQLLITQQITEAYLNLHRMNRDHFQFLCRRICWWLNYPKHFCIQQVTQLVCQLGEDFQELDQYHLRPIRQLQYCFLVDKPHSNLWHSLVAKQLELPIDVLPLVCLDQLAKLQYRNLKFSNCSLDEDHIE